MTVRRRAPALVAAIAMAAGLGASLGGCASGSVESPPAGVDGLVVPTPSPDPRDFGSRVDNPWLPLAVGRTWRYDVADLDGTHRLTVTAEPGPVVAGVQTTARISRERGRRTTDWYAEDGAGNVWWFGRAGVWRAGVGGAEAGLAVPAVPRLGDGWATGYADGDVVGVAEATSLTASVTVPEGAHDHVLVLRLSSPITGDARVVDLARGVGVVEEQALRGSYRVVRLVGTDSP